MTKLFLILTFVGFAVLITALLFLVLA